MNWEDFPPLAKVGIVGTAILTAGLAAVSVALSYDAAYHLVLAHGHYSPKASKVYPLVLDTGFLIAELVAITAAALRPLASNPRKISRWPVGAISIMTICGVGSIWINLLHAGDDKIGMLIAALPPVLMMLSFNVLVAIVRWTSHLMGYEPFDIPPVRELPGRARERLHWSASRGNGQTGHREFVSKAEMARELLRHKKPHELAKATDSSVVRELALVGVEIDPSWASRALADVKAERNGSGR
jgi:hypothetical protein